ncbi:hypothetical protein HO173_013017 [Letharia columbiana]|uniref:Uncharacterized protein n=1 Tax=Letharia columbiana TaxID=112416 RepID=A0A8H6CJH7_9LECA|nr:uncharacterized protein HO173_013017 [Letharia columbiana]KAF6224577.1 hypothetical protein HO173_013017 [Letharia columbiana]
MAPAPPKCEKAVTRYDDKIPPKPAVKYEPPSTPNLKPKGKAARKSKTTEGYRRVFPLSSVPVEPVDRKSDPPADNDGRVQVASEELNNVVDTSKWFRETVEIPPQAQALLEQYSGLVPDQVIPHVTDLTHLAGALKGGERRGLSSDTAFFLHGLESFDKFWQDVGAASGSRLRVNARAEKATEATLSPALEYA